MRRKSQLDLLVCAAALVTALVACGGSDKTTTEPADPGGVLGTYVLKTVDGAVPPGVYFLSASQRLMLDTATIRINANNTYSDIRTTTMFDIAGAHSTTGTRTGTYTVSGSDIVLAFTNDLGIPATQTYTLTGRTLAGTEGPPDHRVALTFMK